MEMVVGRLKKAKIEAMEHQAGVDTVRRITSECVRLGVEYLTFILSQLRTGTDLKPK